MEEFQAFQPIILEAPNIYFSGKESDKLKQLLIDYVVLDFD